MFSTTRHSSASPARRRTSDPLPRSASGRGNDGHLQQPAVMPDDVKRCRSISFRVRAYYELNTRDIGGLYPCRMCPQFTMPCTRRGERGSWDVFHVVVVEYNVEPWVLRDVYGSTLSMAHSHRRRTGRRRPRGLLGSLPNRCFSGETPCWKGLIGTGPATPTTSELGAASAASTRAPARVLRQVR